MMSAEGEADRPAVPQLSEESGLCGGPGQLTCTEANELIQFYLDRATDEESIAKMTAHVGDCPPCEVEVIVYRRIIASLGRCREDIPAETADRLRRFCADLGTSGHSALTED
jgi:hypothetical protein